LVRELQKGRNVNVDKRKKTSIFLSSIQILPCKTSLDIGCGDKPKGIINLDINYKRYQDFFKENGGKFNIIIADSKFLPFKNMSFDEISAYVSLPYVSNEVKVLNEIKRTLRYNGKFILSHHLFPFYVKNFFIYVKKHKLKRAKKFMIYPMYRALDIVLKLLCFLLWNNQQPYWYFWNTSMMTTKAKLIKILNRFGFEIEIIKTKNKWIFGDQFIDCITIKK